MQVLFNILWFGLGLAGAAYAWRTATPADRRSPWVFLALPLILVVGPVGLGAAIGNHHKYRARRNLADV